MKTTDLTYTLAKQYGEGAANLYTSPGRINLIGEHTDYNGGYVMPGAIDKAITCAIRPNGTDIVRLTALDLNDSTEFGLREEDVPDKQWARYVFGVCREMLKRGAKVEGFDAVFCGNVPLGAGLSSSAALESCFAFALNDLFNSANPLPKEQLALVGQSTEHNYCGVNCGIMDQFVSVFGKEGHLILLDCNTLEYKYLPFAPKDCRLILVDSAVKHELVDSPYNRRRESCERVAKALGVDNLWQATDEAVDAIKDSLSEEDYKRAKYVTGEKIRVEKVCKALDENDFDTVGECMYGTHDGLSKQYEVSCEELDYLVDLARKAGVKGSRIMGGGFGGCTINLVDNDRADEFTKLVKSEFSAKYGHEPKIYDVTISDGARKL